MVRKLNGISGMSASSTYFSSSPLQKLKSVGDGEMGGGVVMVLLSGILKFHLYTLLEWGRNVFLFMSGKHLTTRDFSTIRGKHNSIYVHGSQTCKLSNSYQ